MKFAGRPVETGDGIPLTGCQALALLAASICLGLWPLLAGCAPESREDANAPSPTTAIAGSDSEPRAEETTVARAEVTTSPRPPTANVAENIEAAVDEPSIRQHLNRLTGASPAPLSGGPVVISERGSTFGRRAAAEYMEESFEGMGISARTLRFDSEAGRGFNVEATLRGTAHDGNHLWVTAHLDSVHNRGANDDASGLVLILLVAEALKDLDLEHSVHFVAYDLEEVGLVGSSVYVGDTVRSIRLQEGDSAIIGNIHNDMVGYEEDQFNAFIGTCGRAGSVDDAFERASQMLDDPIDLDEVCLERSDHQHFWDTGLSAVVLTDGGKYDGYPWYHEPGDTLDKLNLSYLREMTRLVATTAALLASPKRSSVGESARGHT